jgi:cytochrome c553
MKNLLFGVLAFVSATGAVADEPVKMAANGTVGSSYTYCTVCHGAHGNGNRAINAPKIAGMEPWYLKRQLQQFRTGTRGTKPTDAPGLEMQPVGEQLSDSAIDAVVAYVTTLEPKAPPVTVRGDVKRGRALYASCLGCHGVRGEGNTTLNAPALAGQTDWYLVTQLERFRAGERGFAPQDEAGNQMRAAAAVLPDSGAINDVVAYINAFTARRRGS